MLPIRQRAQVGGLTAPPIMNKPGGDMSNMGDIGSALQSLRSAVGYAPGVRRANVGGVFAPNTQPGPQFASGEEIPASQEMMDKAGKFDIINNKGLGTVSQMQGPTSLGQIPQDFAPPEQALGEQPTTSFAMQNPGMVGAGGNFQQFGGGRFGGNPPPNILARRRGAVGGITDRRQLLNNRMRSRISQFSGGGGGLGGFDPAQVSF